MIKSLKNFVGMFPRYTTYTLPETAAQNLVDGRVTSNGLEAYRADLIVEQAPALYPSFYRHYRQDGSTQWLYFDKPVDICRSGVLDDVSNRTLISGLDKFRIFDSDTLKPGDTTITPENSCVAGIPRCPRPSMVDATPSETPATGSDESRTYVVAYARVWEDSGKIDLGETSEPAFTSGNITYIDCKTDSQIKLYGIRRDSYLVTDHKVNRVYIYRSTVNSDGVATYRYLVDFPLNPGAATPPNVIYDVDNNTVGYLDVKEAVDLGEACTNIGWTAPPDDIQGITTLRNGVLAGYKDNTVYLSVPYQGHAWPAAYRYPSDYKVRGLGAFGNTLVVCTEAITYLLNASDPSLAFLTPIQEAHACVSKESICSLDNSCVYATKYGLIQITGNGASIITRDLISDLEWVRLRPETIRAAMHKGQYVMFWDSEDSSVLGMRGYVIDFNEPERGIIGISQSATGMFEDPVDNALYLLYKYSITGAPVIASFADSPFVRKAYTWTSKTFLDNTGLFNLSAGKVNFHKGNLFINQEDDSFEYVASWHPLNLTQVNTFPINGDANTNNKIRTLVGTDWCQLSLYVDDVLRHTTYIYNNKPFRLPAGFRGDSYYITITSTEPITRVQVSSSIGELE